MTPTLQNISVEKGRRILIAGDLHGGGKFLRRLLAEVNFCPQDELFLLGDYVEKGEASLDTLRLVMQLSHQPNVHALQGNVDLWRAMVLTGELEVPADENWQQLQLYRRWWGTSLLQEMAEELCLPLTCQEELAAALPLLRDKFAPEIRFLRELPTLFRAGDLTFVHGGLPTCNEAEWPDRAPREFMKVDAFSSRDLRFENPVIVGHWPATLYRSTVPCHDPLWDRQRNILSMDGGCGLKTEGQLNLAVLPDIESRDFSFYAWDDLPAFRATEDQQPSTDSLNLTWTDREVEVLAKEGDFCRIRHLTTGRELRTPRSMLHKDEGVTSCNQDVTDHVLPVKKGELLKLVSRHGKACLCKKQGFVGWYYGELVPAGEAPAWCGPIPTV